MPPRLGAYLKDALDYIRSAKRTSLIRLHPVTNQLILCLESHNLAFKQENLWCCYLLGQSHSTNFYETKIPFCWDFSPFHVAGSHHQQNLKLQLLLRADKPGRHRPLKLQLLDSSALWWANMEQGRFEKSLQEQLPVYNKNLSNLIVNHRFLLQISITGS